MGKLRLKFKTNIVNFYNILKQTCKTKNKNINNNIIAKLYD